MNPFVSTIVKQGVALGAFAFLLVAGIYVLVQLPKLQHAMSLNMIPGQLP